MPEHPFILPFDKLPPALAVFPLPGATLLPGTQLTLNIFEPRYLNMVFDALREAHLIGMIQPTAAPAPQRPSLLAATGCAGRISSYAETRDGRLVIVLYGVCRFLPGEEIATTRGYRRICVDWSPFAADYRVGRERFAGRHRLKNRLALFATRHRLELAWSTLERMADGPLINFLATHLPLGNGDKQTLLEAPDTETRGWCLVNLLEAEIQYGRGVAARRRDH